MKSLFFHPSYLLAISFFGLSQFIGITIALSAYARATELPSTEGFTGLDFLIIFFFATIILLLLLKYVKKPIVFIILFYIAIVQGVWIFSSNLFEFPLSVGIFLVLIFSLYWFRNVLTHDILIIIAIAGIAAFFGLLIDPLSAITVLVILAMYDYWAVYKTKHMVKLFKGMAEKKVHFAYIIPLELKGLYTKLKHVNVGSGFFFLGTGDVALPLILAIASLKISLAAALWVSIGALGGYTLLYYIFVRNRGGKPMAGLPPIVTGSLVGFLIGYFF